MSAECLNLPYELPEPLEFEGEMRQPELHVMQLSSSKMAKGHFKDLKAECLTLVGSLTVSF